MSRRDKFRQAVAARQQEKSQENGGQYEDIEYVALRKNKQTALRFIGLPHEVREDGSDVRLLKMAMIRDDRGKWFRAIFPEETDWFLYRVYKQVCEYEWDEESNTPNYLHSDLDIFKTVRYNDVPPQQRRMQKGWMPQSSFLINVIDRADPEWHAKNKHSKVIAKKKSQKDENIYYTPGLPVTAYKGIQDDIQRHEDNIDWEEYDIVVEKLDSDPWYKVYHGEKDSHRLDNDVADLIVSGSLTAEEQEYELYDFDKLFPITSYRKILNRLRMKIKDVDEAFNTRFLEELEDLAAAEKKEADKRKKESAGEDDDEDRPARPSRPASRRSEPSEVEDEDEDVRDEDEDIEEERPPARRRRRKAEPEEEQEAEEEKFSVDSLSAREYKGIKGLSQDMKDLIVGVNDDGSLIYDTDTDLLPCPECDFDAPEELDRCPKCGVEFE